MIIGVANPFVVTRWWAVLFALVALVVPLVLAHWLSASRSRRLKGMKRESTPAVVWRRQGLGGLIIGGDGRASTSKVQVVLWTFAVFFAFAFLLLWGRSTSCGSHPDARVCLNDAAHGRLAFSDFQSRDLQPAYFILLGIPVTAAIGARVIKTNKLAEDPASANPLTEPTGGILQGLSEIVSNDNGETDLLDFQYFAFNLLLLAYFLVQFLVQPSRGLPDLPPTLLVLAGISGGGYMTKKALDA